MERFFSSPNHSQISNESIWSSDWKWLNLSSYLNVCIIGNVKHRLEWGELMVHCMRVSVESTMQKSSHCFSYSTSQTGFLPLLAWRSLEEISGIFSNDSVALPNSELVETIGRGEKIKDKVWLICALLQHNASQLFSCHRAYRIGYIYTALPCRMPLEIGPWPQLLWAAGLPLDVRA